MIPEKGRPLSLFYTNFHSSLILLNQYICHNPEIKTLNYFNALRLQDKMKEFMAVDVLYHQGTVTECSREVSPVVTINGHPVGTGKARSPGRSSQPTKKCSARKTFLRCHGTASCALPHFGPKPPPLKSLSSETGSCYGEQQASHRQIPLYRVQTYSGKS